MGAFGCANPRVRVAATAVAPAPRAPIRVRAWRRLPPGPLLAFVMVPPVLDGGTLARGRRECQDRSRQELSQYSCRVSLKGKTALVTGASRNIGRAIALAFAAEGADLVLNTRVNGDELDAVAAECRKAGVRAVPILADVGDAAAVDAMVQQGIRELGAIDVLVCNAAIRPHKSITDTTLEEWHRVMAVDLHSAFYLARAVVPAMKARRHGSIIALGGQSSITSRANTAAVTTAKTGLLGLIRALAAELGPFG